MAPSALLRYCCIVENKYVRLIAGVAVCAAVAAAGWIYYQNEAHDIKARQSNLLKAITELKIRQIGEWRAQRLADANTFAQGPLTRDTVTALLAHPAAQGLAEGLAAQLHLTMAAYGYEGISVFSTSGSAAIAMGSMTHTIEPAVAAALPAVATWKTAGFIDFYNSAFHHESHLNVLSPVRDKAEKLVAFLCFQLNAKDYLEPLIQTWPTPSASAETLLVRRDGGNVLILNQLRHKKTPPLSLTYPMGDTSLLVVQAASGASGIVEGTDYRGASVLAYVLPVPDSPWVMIAKEDSDEILAELRLRGTTVAILCGGLISGFLLTAAWLRSRHQFSHFRKLYDNERQLRRNAMEFHHTLQDSEQRYRSLFDHMLDGFARCRMIFDENGAPVDFIYLDVNQSFTDITGLCDVIGKPVSVVIPGILEASPELFEVYGRVVRTGKPERFEFEFKTNNQWLNIAVYCPDPGQFVTVFEDITARKHTEQEKAQLNTELEQRVADRTAQLAASNKELEAFAYSISHDLRAPLRAIDGFSQFLEEDYAAKLDAEGRRLLKVVRDNTHTMDRLITELLSLSRVSRINLNKSCINMQIMANSIYHEITTAEQRSQFDFLVGDLPEIYADPTLMRLVWSNLLSNAVKYTQPRPVRRIAVTWQNGPSEDIFCVSDTGVGFSQTYAGKLFGVFQRLHPAEDFEGTGVGLAIVDRIVRRHGGRVWAEAAENQGATFYFSLPIRGGCDDEST